jgi:hypothetical protein
MSGATEALMSATTAQPVANSVFMDAPFKNGFSILYPPNKSKLSIGSLYAHKPRPVSPLFEHGKHIQELICINSAFFF